MNYDVRVLSLTPKPNDQHDSVRWFVCSYVLHHIFPSPFSFVCVCVRALNTQSCLLFGAKLRIHVRFHNHFLNVVRRNWCKKNGSFTLCGCVCMCLCSIPLGQIIVKSQQHFRQMGSLNAGKNSLISSVELPNRFVCISTTLELLTVTMHANEPNAITLNRHSARYKRGNRKKHIHTEISTVNHVTSRLNYLLRAII